MVLLLTCVFAVNQPVYAATKATESRTIAIVFDNSGSMYRGGNKAWCRATYAMEVFASMLNKGDTLMVYPMNPITVDGQTYTMDSPFKITDASQANKLRDISTNNAQGTPIESLDTAFEGLKSVATDKKYLIVLTDGTNFHVNGQEVSGRETVVYLDNRLNAVIPEGINCM